MASVTEAASAAREKPEAEWVAVAAAGMAVDAVVISVLDVVRFSSTGAERMAARANSPHTREMTRNIPMVKISLKKVDMAALSVAVGIISAGILAGWRSGWYR